MLCDECGWSEENCQCVPCIRSGQRQYDDGEVCYHWALFDKKEESVQKILSEYEEEDIARALTGWSCHYGGPGRWFTNDPYIARQSKFKILITQRGGLDI